MRTTSTVTKTPQTGPTPGPRPGGPRPGGPGPGGPRSGGPGPGPGQGDPEVFWLEQMDSGPYSSRRFAYVGFWGPPVATVTAVRSADVMEDNESPDQFVGQPQGCPSFSADPAGGRWGPQGRRPQTERLIGLQQTNLGGYLIAALRPRQLTSASCSSSLVLKNPHSGFKLISSSAPFLPFCDKKGGARA